jgi:hypothetical protein
VDIWQEICLHGALNALCHFNVPQTVPVDGEISMAELALRTKLNEGTLSRLIKVAAVSLYFTEPRSGFVAHTIRSKLLSVEEGIRVRLEFR